MRVEKCPLLLLRQSGHAVHVVVPIALDVRKPEQRYEREVLLQREPGLDGEVLAAHEIALAPRRAARAVDERLVETLAGLRGHASVAERLRARERVEGVV